MYNTTASCPTSEGSYPNSSTSWTETTQTYNGKYVCIYVKDGAGRYATLASTYPINIDITAPTTNISPN